MLRSTPYDRSRRRLGGLRGGAALLLRQAKDATITIVGLRAMSVFRSIRWKTLSVEARQPLINDLDNLARVFIVKVIPALDESVGGTGPCRSDQILRVFVKNLGSAPPTMASKGQPSRFA